MSMLILDRDNRDQLAALLAGESWVVACLCAAWCDNCRAYQATFASLAQRHPDKHFIWIDIEDQADLVGELDVENFPTLLIQQADLVAFFGCVQPELGIADRLIAAQAERTPAELLPEGGSGTASQGWRTRCNLRRYLQAAADGESS